jgi:hypothetical protein
VSSKSKKVKALVANPKRQAVAALRGYLYQIWHTVHAWLELKEEDILIVEGAEDFDVVSNDTAIAVQVKNTTAKITLRTKSVIDAISNYWELCKANPDRRVFFHFLTRSEIAVEQGEPFGPGIAGLDLWKKTSSNAASFNLLRRFLVAENKLPPDLIELLKTATPKALFSNLFVPIIWETEGREFGFVEEAIQRKLILHGDKSRLPPSESKKVISRLLKETLLVATKKNNRYLDRASFLEIFESETTEQVPHQEINALRSLAAQQLPSLVHSNSETPFHISLPIICLAKCNTWQLRG